MASGMASGASGMAIQGSTEEVDRFGSQLDLEKPFLGKWDPSKCFIARVSAGFIFLAFWEMGLRDTKN